MSNEAYYAVYEKIKADKFLAKADMLILLEMEIKVAGGRLAWGKLHGISNQWLSDVLSLKQPIGPKILKVLGFNKIDGYERVKK